MNLPRISRVSAFVTGLIVLFVVAVIGIAMSLNATRRSDTLRDSEAQAQRFVNGAEAAVNRSLLGVDVLLASVDTLLDLSHLKRSEIDPVRVDRLVQSAMRQNLLVSRMVLVDAQGNTLTSSDLNAARKPLALPSNFISEVLHQPASSLVISAPVVSFQSSELVLLMGRYIALADGTRVVCVAEVPIPQLTSVLVQGADIEGMQATMERGSGELLIATPTPGNYRNARLSPPLSRWSSETTPTQALARLSQEPAIVVVRKTLYRDVFISVSIPIASALQEWQRQARFIDAGAGAMALLILASGVLALWYLRRLARAQVSIGRAKSALDQALESMVSGFVLLDGQNHVLNWNRRFEQLHPWLEGRVRAQMPFSDLLEQTASHMMPLGSLHERRKWVAHRLVLLDEQHDPRQVTMPNGTILEITERATADGSVVIVYQDVTRLRRAVAEVELLAFYDPLTGLPNRRLLNDRLQQCIHASTRSGRHGVLLFLDLDHFKTLNDTAGHEMGDLLLKQVAQRLKTCVREEDTVARLGGDEFVVMLQNLSSKPLEAASKAQALGESILSRLNKPYQLLQSEYTSTCSIGATLFGTVHQEASELLKEADIAMYQVKNTGRNGLCFFDPDMLAAITARAEMERDLRHALTSQQLLLYYQVQVAEQGRPVGAEVLLRWQHPSQGLVAPGQFIALAEETGLILSIGEWVLRTACLQLKAWEGTPAAELQLAVNVSARQFRNANFVQQVETIVLETGARAHLLKLELTESMVLDNIADTIQKMQQLRALGVHFSLDDFGTGYSSLAYLTRLPLDQLKIDQSFVRNIGVQAGDSAVIDTIISLARSLNLEVIAEGVETVHQRDFLAQHGCVHCQGYLFGRPIPIQDFETWLIPLCTAL
jgi:diguanylate cyclase (GGDEF)-like protein